MVIVFSCNDILVGSSLGFLYTHYLSLFKGTIPVLKLYFHALKSNILIFLDRHREFTQGCKDFMETFSLTRWLKQKLKRKEIVKS